MVVHQTAVREKKGVSRQVITFVIGVLLFLIPLLHAWMLFPLGIQHEQSNYSAIGGMIPNSDARGYYEGANRFLETGFLDAFNTRRPINAILFSMRLWLFNGNFKAALLLQALLCGMACLFVVKTVSRRFGTLAAAITFFVLFIFAGCFTPTTLSEPLGLTLGCLAFVWLWSAIETQKKSMFFFSSFMLMIAMNARSGALFTIPFLVLWIGYFFRERSRKEGLNWTLVMVFLLGLGAGVAFNYALIKLYADPTKSGGALNANFAQTLFGLASGGKGWTYYRTIFPDVSFKSEADEAHFLYAQSLELFTHHPLLLVKGLFRGIGGLGINMVSFFQSAAPASFLLKWAIRCLGIAFIVFGLWRLKKLYPLYKKEIGFLGVGLLGSLLSAGVIWTDGGIRVFAVTVPFVAVLCGIIFSMPPVSRNNDDKPIRWEVWGAGLMSCLLLSAALVGPLLFRAKTSDMAALNFSCPHSNETLFIAKNVRVAPQVNIRNKKDRFIKHIKNSLILENKELLGLTESKVIDQTPVLAMLTESKTGKVITVMAPLALFKKKNEFMGLCTVRLAGSDGVSQVRSFNPINQ